MAYNSKAKIKILYLWKILQEETDAEHGLTMSDLIARLAEYGVSAERKSIYNDIETLREFDIDVRTYRRSPVEYAIERRDFSLGELMLVVDAIQSCRAITDKQAKMLVRNIKTLASNREQALLDRRIHVWGRVKSASESVLGAVDALHDALRLRCKVAFSYGRIGPDGKRRIAHQGKGLVVTPVAISYDDGFYYLTAWNEEYGKMREYRLDRMGPITVIEGEPAVRNDEISAHRFREENVAVFGRFVGEETVATLAVSPSKLEIVTDRFGDAIVSFDASEGNEVRVRVRVSVSEQFFGWVAGLGKVVRLVAPSALVGRYRDYLRFLLDD